MKYCVKCKGKPRPAGHAGMHTGLDYMHRGGRPKVALSTPATIAKVNKGNGAFNGACEAIATEIPAIDERRKKLVAALSVLQEL
jgi:hypothetical protein